MFNIGDLVKSEIFGIGRVTKVVTEEEDEDDIYPIEVVWSDSQYELDEDYENDCYTADGWFYTPGGTSDETMPPQHKITKIKIKGFKNG